MSRCRVAIIGAGAVGCAAARFLASRGLDVTVFERYRLDHDKGSSYGSSRIIRRTYADPHYTRLMSAAYPLWLELARLSGKDLLVRCGGLTFGAVESTEMAATSRSLSENGVAFEALTASDARHRFPGLRLFDGEFALLQDDGGFLRASPCVRAQMGLAADYGATLYENAVVTAVSFDDGHLRIVRDTGDEHTADRVLITAGPWIGDLVPCLSPLLTVTRQYYAYVDPGAPDLYTANRFPVWIDADSLTYGFPQDGEHPGVKIASHIAGRVVSPGAERELPRSADRDPLMAYAMSRMPSLCGHPRSEHTCLYTSTTDEDFLVDAVPGLPNAWFCSACSGHGFKFSILMGKILADLAEGKEPSVDISRFALSRFAAGGT